jgi:hypothetical protein
MAAKDMREMFPSESESDAVNPIKGYFVGDKATIVSGSYAAKSSKKPTKGLIIGVFAKTVQIQLARTKNGKDVVKLAKTSVWVFERDPLQAVKNSICAKCEFITESLPDDAKALKKLLQNVSRLADSLVMIEESASDEEPEEKESAEEEEDEEYMPRVGRLRLQ